MAVVFIIIQVICGILYLVFSKKAEKANLIDMKNFTKYSCLSTISKVIMYGVLLIYMAIWQLNIRPQ